MLWHLGGYTTAPASWRDDNSPHCFQNPCDRAATRDRAAQLRSAAREKHEAEEARMRAAAEAARCVCFTFGVCTVASTFGGRDVCAHQNAQILHTFPDCNAELREKWRVKKRSSQAYRYERGGHRLVHRYFGGYAQRKYLHVELAQVQHSL